MTGYSKTIPEYVIPNIPPSNILPQKQIIIEETYLPCFTVREEKDTICFLTFFAVLAAQLRRDVYD
jgi:hypothetical protein